MTDINEPDDRRDLYEFDAGEYDDFQREMPSVLLVTSLLIAAAAIGLGAHYIGAFLGWVLR